MQVVTRARDTPRVHLPRKRRRSAGTGRGVQRRRAAPLRPGQLRGYEGRGCEAANLLGGLAAMVQCAGTAGDPSLYSAHDPNDHGKFLSISEAEWDAMSNVT